MPVEVDNKPEMKITAIAPWFGGKRNLAPKIIEMLGPHNVYWEPFCGSMAVLMAKPPCRMETVNDLHSDLVNLARVLQNEDTAKKLYGMSARTLMSEELFEEASLRIQTKQTGGSDYEPVDMAYDYLLSAWLGRNGVTGTASCGHSFCVRYTNNGGDSARRWQSVIASIPAWQWRLSKVTILNRDAFEIIGKIPDNDDVAIYVDPPYLVKGVKYLHDFKPEDHVKLSIALRRFEKARVVVSYYDDELLEQLYPGWGKHKIDVSKAMGNTGSRGKKDVRAVEVLLTNEGQMSV